MQTESTRGFRTLLVASLLASCSVPLPPHAPGLDGAGVDAQREDTGSIVVRDSGSPDTGSTGTDANFDANVDAASFDGGNADAGPPLAITLDGLLTDPFWATRSSIMSATPVVTPFDGDTLTSLHYARDAAWLYVGFEGTLVAGDAVVMYVDTHFGSGVPLSGGLGDNANTLNRVLSLPITGTAEFQPEYGWGTSVMPKAFGPGDTTIGWRQLAMAPGSFMNTTANTHSVCSATGCETAMLLAQLGIADGGPIGIVVRLGRPGVGFSNQTYPVADASSPEIIVNAVVVPPAS